MTAASSKVAAGNRIIATRSEDVEICRRPEGIAEESGVMEVLVAKRVVKSKWYALKACGGCMYEK